MWIHPLFLAEGQQVEGEVWGNLFVPSPSSNQSGISRRLHPLYESGPAQGSFLLMGVFPDAAAALRGQRRGVGGVKALGFHKAPRDVCGHNKVEIEQDAKLQCRKSPRAPCKSSLALNVMERPTLGLFTVQCSDLLFMDYYRSPAFPDHHS